MNALDAGRPATCPRCSTPLPTESKFCLNCGANVSGDTGAGTPVPLVISPDVEQALRAELAGMYDIERELGRGGMGAVFLATERQLGRKVAVKVLPPAFTFGQGAVERFKREARTAATLDHPHVIPIYRVSEKDTLLWYAMKYVEGYTLADVLEAEPQLSLARTADIVRQVAEALQYAHDRGVIHRDIKPENVLTDPDGWVTVTDFGIAKASGVASITGSGSMLGTPFYMSPEQCSGVALTAAADQYSLAIMAYRMLTGRLPFNGISQVEVIKQHCLDPVPSLAEYRPEIPPALADVVNRALAKAPEERFPSVRHFADAFRRATRGEALDASTVRGPATPPPSLRAMASAPRRPGVLLGGVGGVAAVTVGVLLLRPWDRGTTPATSTVDSTAPAAVLPLPSNAPATPAVLVLRGVPPGAAVRLDGQPTANPVAMVPGVRHTVAVTAPGFRPWQVALTPTTGDTVRRAIQMAPESGAVAATAPAAPADQPGFLAIGSRPLSAMTINGRSVSSNPVTNLEVAAGLVTIRFSVTDSGGIWTRDTTIAVGPGERKTVGYVRLVRP